MYMRRRWTYINVYEKTKDNNHLYIENPQFPQNTKTEYPKFYTWKILEVNYRH